MASSSSAQLAVLSSLGFLLVSEKLTRGNYPLWRAQVISSIRGAEVDHFLDADAVPPTKFLTKKKEDGDDKDAAPILNCMGGEGPAGPELSACLPLTGDPSTSVARQDSGRSMGWH